MITKQLMKQLNIKNPMAVPKIIKIVVNVGYGKIRERQELIKKINQHLTKITGQKPQVTVSKKAISGFKVRQGEPIGFRVTLRRRRAQNFLDKLINVTIPRIRDFRGLELTGFDQNGNYNLGIKEQVIFPEINPEESDNTFGMSVSIVTTARDRQQATELLKAWGFPLKRNN